MEKKSPKIDRLRKNLVWAGGGLGSDIRQTVSFLLACMCLWGGGWAGFGIVRHQILLISASPIAQG